MVQEEVNMIKLGKSSNWVDSNLVVIVRDSSEARSLDLAFDSASAIAWLPSDFPWQCNKYVWQQIGQKLENDLSQMKYRFICFGSNREGWKQREVAIGKILPRSRIIPLPKLTLVDGKTCDSLADFLESGTSKSDFFTLLQHSFNPKLQTNRNSSVGPKEGWLTRFLPLGTDNTQKTTKGVQMSDIEAIGELLNVHEAAHLLQLNTRTVHKMLSDGRLKGRKILGHGPNSKGRWLIQRSVVEAQTESSISRSGKGQIYFIQGITGGPIKIGYTKNDPEKRLYSLGQMSPIPLKIIATMDGLRQTERKLHVQFAHIRRHGEWFEPSDEMILFISQNTIPWKD